MKVVINGMEFEGSREDIEWAVRTFKRSMTPDWTLPDTISIQHEFDSIPHEFDRLPDDKSIRRPCGMISDSSDGQVLICGSCRSSLLMQDYNYRVN